MTLLTNQQVAIHVSMVTIFWNLTLSIFKFLAGILAHSGAMLSDAVHSASDVFSTVIVMIGVKVAGKEADKSHPYGHERLECVAALLLAIILFATGIGIGILGIKKIFNAEAHLIVPAPLALVAAIISIIIKETMYWYTRAAARRIHCGALMADAWHHRSDALSSVGSLIGILGARMGLPVLDTVASVIICIFIIKASVDIFIDSINKMIDKSCDEQLIEEISGKIFSQDGVLGIGHIKTRIFGDRIYVEAEIQANGTDTLNQSHEIAKRVHDCIEAAFPVVKHCMVQVHPKTRSNTLE